MVNDNIRPLLNTVPFRLVPPWVWLLLAGIAVIDIIWIAVTAVSIAPSSYILLAQSALLAVFGIFAGHRLDAWPRFQMMAIGGAFMALAWPTLRFYNHLTMTTGFPMVDGQLAAMDVALGFDWLRYVQFLDQNRMLTIAMDFFYDSLADYVTLLFLALLCTRDGRERCRELATLFLLTAIICSTLGMAFPAVAAAEFHAPTAALFQTIDPYAGSYHLSHLGMLRDLSAPVLDLADMPGLVTFPSFHTALGVVAIYCARSSRWLFAGSAVANGLMIASTPLFGAHYGVDVIGGAAVAFGAIAMLKWLDELPLTQMARAQLAPA